MVDLDSSEDNQNSENPGITATITETSHAGKILDWLESLPTVMPVNTHTNMVNLEAQIQGIDMELNKFDTHSPYTANPGIMHELFPSLPIYSDQVHARDKLLYPIMSHRTPLMNHVTLRRTSYEPGNVWHV